MTSLLTVKASQTCFSYLNVPYINQLELYVKLRIQKCENAILYHFIFMCEFVV